MDNFEQPSAKLLYLINEMNTQKMITSVEKALLKQHVLQENPGIYDLLKKYPTSEFELDLADLLIELVRGPQEPNQVPAHAQQVEEEEYQKGMEYPSDANSPQSPLGYQLLKRKGDMSKKAQKKQEGFTMLKS